MVYYNYHSSKGAIYMASTLTDHVKNNNLFHEYNHSIPIIYSHIENQYPFHYSNTESFTILYTNFDYHFVVGDIPTIEEFKKEISLYIRTNQKEEFILFAPNQKWETFLEQVFQDINGVIDQRVEYDLDIQSFNKLYENHVFKHKVNVIRTKDEGALQPYFKAEVQSDSTVIGYCRGFMIGKNHVELDVFTKVEQRQKQIAYETSLTLINHLLNEGFTPKWTCWNQKELSKNLAKKLGFAKPKLINAHIWVKDFGWSFD